MRRARHLVLYWQGSRLVVHNYATGRRVQAGSVALPLAGLLQRVEDPGRDCGGARPSGARSLTALVERLVARSLLERSDGPEDPRTRAMATLDRWNPEAGLLPHGHERRSILVGSRSRPPGPRAGAPLADARAGQALSWRRHVSTCLGQPEGRLPEVLVARRTWRRFSSRPLSLEDLAHAAGIVRRRAAVGPERSHRARAENVSVRRRPASDRVLRGCPATCKGSAPASTTMRPTGTRSNVFGVRSRSSASGQLLPEQQLLRQGAGSCVPDRGLCPPALALPLFARVSGCPGRGRSRLPDVLPDGHVARVGAILPDGPGRQPHRAATSASTALQNRCSMPLASVTRPRGRPGPPWCVEPSKPGQIRRM